MQATIKSKNRRFRSKSIKKSSQSVSKTTIAYNYRRITDANKLEKAKCS